MPNIFHCKTYFKLNLKALLTENLDYQSMLKELTNIEAEFEDAELYAESKQQAHEERGKLQMEAAEMANDAFVRVKVLLAKLNQDKEGISKFQLKTCQVYCLLPICD